MTEVRGFCFERVTYGDKLARLEADRLQTE